MVTWVILVNFIQTELIVEIYSKRLVRAIGKILFMKLSHNTNQTHIKVMQNGLCFVNKQLFWWFASITLDINNGVFTDF